MKVAVLDIGASTLHLQHVQVEGGVVTGCSLDEKVPLRLGDRVIPGVGFDDATRDGICGAVDSLLEHSARESVDGVCAVGTSPFRDAENADEVVERLRERGLGLRILGALEEAELSFLGNAEPHGVRTAVVDLGGGSAEVAVGDGFTCLHAQSTPIGSVRLRQWIAPRGSFGHREWVHLRESLLDVVATSLAPVRSLAPERLIFASGTARAVRTLALGGATGPITLDDLDDLLQRHLGKSPIALQTLGVSPLRADTILIAAATLRTLMDLAGMNHAQVSPHGLRQGVALQYTLGREVARPHLSATRERIA